MKWTIGGAAMSGVTTVAMCVALLATVLAGLTTWWIFADPAGVATAIESRDWRVLFAPLARGVVRALLAR